MTDSTRRARSGRRTSEAARAPRINQEECPLAWLARRKDKDGQPLISTEQLQAGEKLRRDYTFAMLMPRVTASYTAAPASASHRGAGFAAGAELTDNVLAARELVNRALAAVGPELGGVLVDVCCHLRGLEMIERASGWPQRSSKIVLGIALQLLARHYGLTREATSGVHTSRARIRHWGAEGYRPSLTMDPPGED